MRVWAMPAVVVGIFVVTGFSDEPSETAMRAAFQARLAAEVSAALDFAAATGGEGAVARIHEAHTDAYDIRGFNKLACMPSARAEGHVCTFAVRIGVATGEIERQLTGRFYDTARGLEFVEDAAAGA